MLAMLGMAGAGVILDTIGVLDIGETIGNTCPLGILGMVGKVGILGLMEVVVDPVLPVLGHLD